MVLMSNLWPVKMLSSWKTVAADQKSEYHAFRIKLKGLLLAKKMFKLLIIADCVQKVTQKS